MTMTVKARRSYIFVNRRDRILDLCLSYRDFKENGHYAVECPELGLMDQGKTKAEAYEHLAENIFTTLVTAIETGNLRAHLKALGFRERKIPIPDAEIFDIRHLDEPDLVPLTLKANLPVGTKSGQGQFQLCT
jgi:predicted RNase H-like HicB family nuclease